MITVTGSGKQEDDVIFIGEWNQTSLYRYVHVVTHYCTNLSVWFTSLIATSCSDKYLELFNDGSVANSPTPPPASPLSQENEE